MDQNNPKVLTPEAQKLVEDLLNQVLAETHTQTAALRRLRALREMLTRRLFSNSQDLSVTDPDDLNWLYKLGENFFAKFNQKNIYDLIDYLENEIKNARVLIIYIPFSLPETELVKLSNKLRATYGPNFLIETKLDPQLIGGCALVWQGIYKDYSIKQKIKNNQENILTTFRQYFKR